MKDYLILIKASQLLNDQAWSYYKQEIAKLKVEQDNKTNWYIICAMKCPPANAYVL